MNLSFGLLDNFQEETALRVEKIEAKVDRYEDELGTYLIKLNQKDLSLEDSHSLSIMLHCIGDFERISDHALSIMKFCKGNFREKCPLFRQGSAGTSHYGKTPCLILWKKRIAFLQTRT
mgnify:CR=1 FL=1